MISLSVSFASLVWALKPVYEGEMINIPVKYKILNFLTHLLLLSGRLLAITFFVVGFKWFIIFTYLLHVIVMFTIRKLWPYTDDYDLRWWCEFYLVFGLSWIGYDTFDTDGDEGENAMSNLKIITISCHFFLALQNFLMTFVFIGRLRPWYALPLFVCVCSFSVLGVGIRCAVHALDYAPMGQGKSTINRVVKGVKWWLKI